jgi:hypothetical protein
MQTFLPYPDFKKTAAVLDRKRLGKQRVEAYQILRILRNEQKTNAWKNHPAVLMWKSHEKVLANYGEAICSEWIRRGYKDTLKQYFEDTYTSYLDSEWVLPKFLGNTKFHKSHQSNLLRKDFQYYSKYFKNIPTDLPYVWPTNENL